MTNTQPAVPKPDEKDWTWAIHQRCSECGFDPATVDHDNVPELTLRFITTIAGRLDHPDATTRPQPAVWAPVEYAAHVRDVCRLFAERLDLMLTQDDPQFANWDQDATALEQRYWEQQASVVAGELRAAAATIGAAFGRVSGVQWDRPGRRSNGSMFTVETFARYFLHDLAHHAWDVTGRQW